jgi:ribosome-associated protein
VSSEGVVTIACDRFRDRARNVEECTSRLRQLVEDILAPPRERKRLKVPRSVKERRLESKRSTSARKRTRRAPTHDD